MRPDADEGEKRTNEIGTVIPLLETAPDIAGRTITADALLTQRALASYLLNRGADYLFTVNAFSSFALVKFRSRLFTALIRVPSTATSSRPNSSSSRHSLTNPRNTWRNAARLIRRKSAIVLKSGDKRRNSQITSRLRLLSASSRQLERTRFNR